jgi:hypothetical protein
MSRCGGSSAPTPTPAPVYQPTSQDMVRDKQLRLEAAAEAKKNEAKRLAQEKAAQAHERALEAQRQRQAEKEIAEDRAADNRELQGIAAEREADEEKARVQQRQYQPPAQAQIPLDQGSGQGGYQRLGTGDYEMHTGPKGGRYHISANGNKVYHKR